MSTEKPLCDDTQPANRAILFYTSLGIVTLFGLVPFFHTYMDGSQHEQRHEHLESSYRSAQLVEYRAEERRRLASGATPIEDAIAQLGERGRAGFPDIRPTPSDDEGPLHGWTRLPRELPARPAPEPPPPAVVPSELPTGGPTDAPTDAPTAAVAPAAPGAPGVVQLRDDAAAAALRALDRPRATPRIVPTPAPAAAPAETP